MKFEWDEEKNTINIRKHGIDFADVAEMFSHPMLVHADQREDYGEDRWIGVGLMKDIIIVIAFTERGEEKIRIISARKATKFECKNYEKEITHSMEKITDHEG